MLSIEDCLELLDVINWDPPADDEGTLLSITNTWDRRFISDICYHTRTGKAITTAQGALALKLINRYRIQLAAYGVTAAQLDALAHAPQYRLPPHTSVSVPREVRWLGNSVLAFRSKYNNVVTEDIKKLRVDNPFNPTSTVYFHKEDKLWLVEVQSRNVDRVIEVIRRHGFAFDDAVAEFLMEVSNSLEQPSSAEIVDGAIRVHVRNDMFLNEWFNDLHWLT